MVFLAFRWSFRPGFLTSLSHGPSLEEVCFSLWQIFADGSLSGKQTVGQILTVGAVPECGNCGRSNPLFLALGTSGRLRRRLRNTFCVGRLMLTRENDRLIWFRDSTQETVRFQVSTSSSESMLRERSRPCSLVTII